MSCSAEQDGLLRRTPRLRSRSIEKEGIRCVRPMIIIVVSLITSIVSTNWC